MKNSKLHGRILRVDGQLYNHYPRAYQNKKAELNGPELRVPPVGLGGPGGTSRYGHYWDIAAPRDVNQIKSPIISVEPTDYNGSKEFCSVS